MQTKEDTIKFRIAEIQMKHSERIMYFIVFVTVTCFGILILKPILREAMSYIYTTIWSIGVPLVKWIISARAELNKLRENIESKTKD